MFPGSVAPALVAPKNSRRTTKVSDSEFDQLDDFSRRPGSHLAPCTCVTVH
jgi:hypothetical protein